MHLQGVRVARAHSSFFYRGYLYVSASVCELKVCTAAVKKKKESFPNYVANLIHTVRVCACVFCNLVGTEWVSCQNMRGWVRVSVCVF